MTLHEGRDPVSVAEDDERIMAVMPTDDPAKTWEQTLMDPTDPVTRFAHRTRLQALIILAGTVMVIAWCLVVATTNEVAPSSAAPAEVSPDEELFRRIVERVQRGEGYYDAAGSQLRLQGFPTRSMFNWRLPLFTWLFSRLPSLSWARAILTTGVFGVLLIAPPLIQRERGMGMWLANGLLLAGALLACAHPTFFFHLELWSGMLIVYSLCAYACGRWHLGALLGLLALFFRELALPYCVVSLALAWRGGRRAEVATWIAGLALFGLFLTYHAIEVSRRITATDLAHQGGWIKFGGTKFILSLSNINMITRACPAWFTTLYLSLALLGLAGWRGPMGARIGMTTFLYIAAFAIVGRPCNWYWGWIFAPLLTFGFVWSPIALRDLVRAIRWPVDACARPLPPELQVV